MVDYIKVRNFSSSKDNIKRVKSQVIEWGEDIFNVYN